MTFELLEKIIKKNNIPPNVHLLQDCGWECGATELDGVWYNRKRNEIQFTQCGKFYFHGENVFKDMPHDVEESEHKSEWFLIYYNDGKGRKTEVDG